jgi:hypothetical protein
MVLLGCRKAAMAMSAIQSMTALLEPRLGAMTVDDHRLLGLSD